VRARWFVAGAALTSAIGFSSPARTTVVERYDNGRIKREAQYRNGKLDGITRGWYENGAIEYERRYRSGEEDGEHRGWYPDGAVRFVYHYARGRSEGEQRQWFDNGRPLTWFNHVHGQEVGLQRMWNADGTVRSSYAVRDGKRYGLVGSTGCTGKEPEKTSAIPYYRDSTFLPEWLTATEAADSSVHRIEPFVMTDQHGVKVTERAFAGHVTIVQFFFTRCGDICPTTTSNIARAVGSLPDSSVQVLSYSVTPEADSVSALRAFARMHGITDTRWHLLAGARSDLERLARRSYLVRLGDGTTYGVASIAHTESVLLIDGNRRIRGVYAGTLALDMARLVEDAHALAREKPAM
jgi:protein SCO1/2